MLCAKTSADPGMSLWQNIKLCGNVMARFLLKVLCFVFLILAGFAGSLFS
jgi:hypothetical protein